MKESYPDDIMLCFVQGYSNGDCNKLNGFSECKESNNNSIRLSKRRSKKLMVSIDSKPNILEESTEIQSPDILEEESSSSEVVLRNRSLVTGKSLQLSSGEKLLNRLPEVKRSFSDRFSVITDATGRKTSKGLLTIRKTWSTGNFAAGGGGAGGGGPRSAPATPLQLEPHPRSSSSSNSHKQEKHAVKPLSGSAPSVRAAAEAADSTTEGKHMSKSRQKKFQRHFPQVGPEERVLNYYSCALVGDLLLQGHLYITKNYFAFYSNVFGYVTKLLIPITSVLRITKEKVARIIPNAVGVCTRDERHVFGSLLSRDSTYKLMTHVWKAARLPDTSVAKPQISEIELDASEYSPEDDSSSGGADHVDAEVTPVKREPEVILSTAGAAVIQPALLTGSSSPVSRSPPSYWRTALLCLAFILTASAGILAYRLAKATPQDDLIKLSGEDLYSELIRWRARAHGRAAQELHAFLSTNLLLLTKVRQSLEALSGVILTDLAQANVEIPNDTAFS